jgi:hypothetical protein
VSEAVDTVETPFLSPAFIEAMNELGEYAHQKHGEDNLLEWRDRRRPGRHSMEAIADHAKAHFEEYLVGIPHDYFKTRRHQLAAVAFNAMMEFHFAGLDSWCVTCNGSGDIESITGLYHCPDCGGTGK